MDEYSTRYMVVAAASLENAEQQNIDGVPDVSRINFESEKIY